MAIWAYKNKGANIEPVKNITSGIEYTIRIILGKEIDLVTASEVSSLILDDTGVIVEDDGSGGGAEPPYRQYDSQPANDLYYKGWAEAADTSTATWMIVKGVETSHDVFLELWADGNEDLDNIWEDRASLIYS